MVGLWYQNAQTNANSYILLITIVDMAEPWSLLTILKKFNKFQTGRNTEFQVGIIQYLRKILSLNLPFNPCWFYLFYQLYTKSGLPPAFQMRSTPYNQ